MIDAITLELYRDIAREYEPLREQARRRHMRDARVFAALSVFLAGVGAASFDYPPISNASLVMSGMHTYNAFNSRKKAQSFRSSDSGILTRIFLHPDGFVTLNTKGCGLEEIVDGRGIEHAALELDERPTLVTNISVEPVRDDRYAMIADISILTDIKPGTYDWLIVRKLRGHLNVLAYPQKSGTTLASTSTV